MTEANETNAPYLPPRKISRSRFLSYLGAVGGAGALSLLTGGRVLDNDLHVQDQIERDPVDIEHTELTDFIEDNFDIELKRSAISAEISVDSLLKLQNALRILPPHFYKPDSPGGERYRLSLHDVPPRTNEGPIALGTCSCGFHDPKSDIRIDEAAIRMFENDIPEQRYTKVVAHELTHLVTIKKHINSPDGNPEHGYPHHTMRNLAGKLVSIFPHQSEFHNAGKKANEKIAALEKTLQQQGVHNREYVEARDAMDGILYGLSIPFPQEFIAQLGSYYTQGKDYFYKYFGEVFPDDKVEQLYAMVRENIFFGKEYDEFEFMPGYGKTEEIEEIIGGPFNEVLAPIIDRIEEEGTVKVVRGSNTHISILPGSNNTEHAQFLSEFVWNPKGFSTGKGRIYTDFVLLAQKQFVKGRNEFNRMYGSVFKQDVVDNLYSFVRDTYFDGIDFQGTSKI